MLECSVKVKNGGISWETCQKSGVSLKNVRKAPDVGLQIQFTGR